MDALKVTDIKKTYKSRKAVVRAVDGISFSVGEHETFGLLGMNGAGKSTAIKICTGLCKPDSGDALVFGHSIIAEAEKAKTLLNVSPQETAIAPALTCMQNLRFVAELYGSSRQDAANLADNIVEQLKLADVKDRRAAKLSGGYKRRLSIGMALVTSPKLVFLDEPTLGLDVVARRELWRFIREIKSSAAVVLTTHYLEEAEALCDRIGIVAEGKLVAVGTAQELKAQANADDIETAFLRLAGKEDII